MTRMVGTIGCRPRKPQASKGKKNGDMDTGAATDTLYRDPPSRAIARYGGRRAVHQGHPPHLLPLPISPFFPQAAPAAPGKDGN